MKIIFANYLKKYIQINTSNWKYYPKFHLHSNSFLAVNFAALDLAGTCGNKYKCQEAIQLTKNTESLPMSYGRLFLFLVWNIVVRKFLKMLYEL